MFCTCKKGCTCSKKKSVRDQAVDAAQSTADTLGERGSSALDQVKDVITPLLSTAADKADELRKQAAPLAGSAVEQARGKAEELRKQAAPLADSARDQAREKFVPLAATAAAAGTAKLQPHLDNARDFVQPHLDTARDRVQEDLVPQLLDLLRQAEENPNLAEVSHRGQAALAALRGDLELPDDELVSFEKKPSKLARVAKFTAVSALVAGLAVAARQFLASKDDAWTAHQPSEGYTPKPATTPAPKVEDVAPKADVKKEEAPAEGTPSTADGAAFTKAPSEPVQAEAEVPSEPDPHEQMSAEGGPVSGAETTNEDIAVLNTYGEGSYVGDEPPAGYTIKGNERSMKYHTEENAGYHRTIADVWFNSPEAAEKAGFTHAQR